MEWNQFRRITVSVICLFVCLFVYLFSLCIIYKEVHAEMTFNCALGYPTERLVKFVIRIDVYLGLGFEW
jgi:hypothetical protein